MKYINFSICNINVVSLATEYSTSDYLTGSWRWWVVCKPQNEAPSNYMCTLALVLCPDPTQKVKFLGLTYAFSISVT